MKNISLLLLFVLFICTACTEEEPILEVFSAEAFAYSLSPGWELNASINAKEFNQEEIEDQYSAKLSYVVNIITPAGDTLGMADYGTVDEKNNEKIMDIQIESQIELDSAFAIGQYKIIFIVTDDLTGQEVSAEKIFELTED